MAYTDTSKISSFLQRSLTSYETSALSGYVLNAVDKWIDRLLGSHFADEEPSTRYFDGDSHSVDIDPVQEVSGIKTVDDEGVDNYDYTIGTEYVLEPANEIVKREIVRRGRDTSHFPRGLQRVAVTGRFTEYDYDNGEVPPDVVLAATRLAAGIMNTGLSASSSDTVKSESLEGHSITYDTGTSTLEQLSNSDPILQNLIASRREVML